MKKLQCEICGGALVMQDGMAVCESCGMKFSKEEVQKMVVELSGPIQIDGEVKVTGMEDADALYRRATDFIKLKDKDSALKNYTEMTTKYPGDYRGWMGLAELSLPSGVLKKEWSDPDKDRFETTFCPACGAGPYNSRYKDSPWHRCTKVSEYEHRDLVREVFVRVPMKLDLKEIENRREQSIQNIQDCMTKAFIAADTSLRGELEEAQKRFLKKCHEIVDQALAEAEKWNQDRADEIIRVKRELVGKTYWKKANTEFLKARFKVKTVLPLLTGLTLGELENQCQNQCREQGRKFHFIDRVLMWHEDRIRFGYYRSGGKGEDYNSISIPILSAYQTKGDIRPLLDGQKTGFFFNSTYSYANDPDKDKGPVFEFEE